MKMKFILVACVATMACACQQKQMDMKNNKDNGNGQNMDDQNYQDRRKQMQQNSKPQTNGCCEAEKAPATQQAQTVATPEVKVEKAQ